MSASEWLSNLPEYPSIKRDNKILEAVSNGLAICTWAPIVSSYLDHKAIFNVSQDAVYFLLDDGSRFRFQVSAQLAQRCADILNASLITSKISDLAYQQANIKLSATILPATADMATTSKSKVWNTLVEKKRKGREGILRDCGKTWVLSNKLTLRNNIAINYGFYDPSAPYTNKFGQRMWQTLGTRHNTEHSDYSQTLVIMSSVCQVDGQQMKVCDVMQSSTLCGLISDEGVLKFTRQPNVL